jgi:hypothetical protein
LAWPMHAFLPTLRSHHLFCWLWDPMFSLLGPRVVSLPSSPVVENSFFWVPHGLAPPNVVSTQVGRCFQPPTVLLDHLLTMGIAPPCSLHSSGPGSVSGVSYLEAARKLPPGLAVSRSPMPHPVHTHQPLHACTAMQPFDRALQRCNSHTHHTPGRAVAP